MPAIDLTYVNATDVIPDSNRCVIDFPLKRRRARIIESMLVARLSVTLGISKLDVLGMAANESLHLLLALAVLPH